MIEQIDDLPEPLVGLRFSGQVTRDEYERIILPAMQSVLERDEGARLLVVIDEGFERFEAGALWEDMKFGLGSGLRHLSKWERTALVSDASWAHHAIGLLGWMVPGDVRVFPLDELDAATAWLATA
jgi:hypothetical protein